MEPNETLSGNLAYQNLRPEHILEAVASAGFRCGGCLLALNSYENRVYQVGLECDRPIVAKFYRPGRWSDAAIFEEHAFSPQLADAEIPVVAPSVCAGQPLHPSGPFRFSVSPVSRWARS